MDEMRIAYKFLVNLNVRGHMGDPKIGPEEMGSEGFVLD
jgi:hypothetical protein